ncbi:MAG: NifB/NifX family molybdenum-iron cluster-binding protein [Dysgonomonas sp.]
MKIVITSTGSSLDSDLDIHFGRCSYFVFYDTESHEYEFAVNDNRDADEKAGNMAVHFIVSQGAEKAVSGIFGIKIKSLMNDAGIQMITFQKKITVKEIISLLKH